MATLSKVILRTYIKLFTRGRMCRRCPGRSSGLIWEHIHPHECISLPISNTGCPDERKKAYFANQFRKTFFTNIYHPFNTTVNTLHKQRRYMPMPISAWHIYIMQVYLRICGAHLQPIYQKVFIFINYYQPMNL